MKNKKTAKTRKTRKLVKRYNIRNSLGRFTKNYNRDSFGRFA